MTTEIAVAVIVLCGVLVSVIASVIMSTRQAKTEMKKLRTEVLQIYSGKLFEKRLEVYPEIFVHICSVIQKVNFSSVSAVDIKGLFPKFRDWEAKNAIFMGAHLQQSSHKLVLMLNEWANLDENRILDRLSDRKLCKDLKKQLQEIELALKSDLGIYALDSPSAIKDFISPSSYKDIDKLAEKETKY